jgi:hypothetical protein
VYDQKRGSQVRSPEGFQMDTKPGSIVLRPTLWRILSQNSLTGIEDRNVVRIRERQARSTPAMDCKGGTSEANSPREIWTKRRWIGGGVESGAQGIGAAHRGTRRAGGPSQGRDPAASSASDHGASARDHESDRSQKLKRGLFKMNDALVLASFGIGYVAAGLLILTASVSSLKPQMKLVPVKVRSRQP